MIFMFLCLLSCALQRNITDMLKDQLKPVPPVPSPSWSHNELNRICPLVSIYRGDHQRQAKGSVKCGDDRSLQCQRLGCDILQHSGLKSLEATFPCLPSISLSFLLVTSFHLCSVCHRWLWQSRDSDSFRFVVVLWYEGLECPWTLSLLPLSLWCTCHLFFVSVQVHLGPYFMLASIPLRCPSCQTL